MPHECGVTCAACGRPIAEADPAIVHGRYYHRTCAPESRRSRMRISPLAPTLLAPSPAPAVPVRRPPPTLAELIAAAFFSTPVPPAR